jgi:SAM-dependent methyltransferase
MFAALKLIFGDIRATCARAQPKWCRSPSDRRVIGLGVLCERLFLDRWHDLSAHRHTLTTDDKERVDGRFARAAVSILLRHFDFDRMKASTIMDYGCGTGRLSKYFGTIFGRVICADISPKMIETCRERLSHLRNIDYVVVDPSKQLPFSDGEIDTAVSYASLGYMSTAEEFWRTIGEIDRVSCAFALQLHAATDESPNASLTIAS